MSHAHDHNPTVPPGALIAAAALLLFTMALTGAVRLGLIPQSGDPDGSRAAQQIAPAQVRELRFADRADGAVVVTDAATGAKVMEIGFGEGGFVRATLRRMAKVRADKQIGSEPPFKLIRWENGALTLTDPQTGKDAEIQGFGPDHTATFASMLQDGRS
ncbi:photosynthetic complex assembly protein PuhC [Parasphingorhabdus sp.]|uniref:photosynthetic complex assembly protein PuhC n=1 Tax=Parasphingorhabdus sp. TaxID=2709688 RepID=UPI0030027649